MKKLTVIIALIIILLCLVKTETIIIPKEAIRFRVIANSNTIEDQNTKKQVVSDLGDNIKTLNLIPKNISATRTQIKKNIPLFRKTVEKTLKDLNASPVYTIEYGMNYFPEKQYNGVIYEEGEYESLIIKLGDGNGDNFWCVLFPPLCLLEGEKTDATEVEYTSFIKELIDKYF